MADAERIEIEVAYARPDTQLVVRVQVSPQVCLEEAIRLSGILQQCPEIDLSRNRVGIFGKLATLEQHLRPGDRVEIYRPLIADPKLARKRRARQEKREDA